MQGHFSIYIVDYSLQKPHLIFCGISWSALLQLPSQKAFECLKMVVTTALVLVSSQDSEPFRIKANSSDFASGAVLSQ